MASARAGSLRHDPERASAPQDRPPDGDTGSLSRAIKETNRRRERQLAWNKEHGITPTTIKKSITSMFGEIEKAREKAAKKNLQLEAVADKRPAEEILREKEAQMRDAAKNLEFELAALLRDEIGALRKKKKAPAPEDGTGGKRKWRGKVS